MHSAPEEVEERQQNQSDQNLVPKRNDLGTVNATGVPANLRKMQVVWTVHEFHGDEGTWFIGHLKQYLSNRGLELPIGPFLSSEQTLSYFSDLEQYIWQEHTLAELSYRESTGHMHISQ
jgi:hypothetical protein